MKAIELLKDYRNIDFGCNVEELHSEIDEAIKELEDFIAKYQEVSRRLDSTVITLAILQNENKSLLKALTIK